jgi:hypothetical protein
LTLSTADAHLRCGQIFERTTTVAIAANFLPGAGTNQALRQICGSASKRDPAKTEQITEIAG